MRTARPEGRSQWPGGTLAGAWLVNTEGTWEQDFALTYHRITG